MRRLSLLLSVVALAGCMRDSQPLTLEPTDADVTGTFSLTSSNGRSLPLIVRLTVDEQWDLVSDQFLISSDNTWKETTNYSIKTFATSALSTQQSVSSGTYTISNKQINFVMTVGGTTPFTGSVTGNNLAVLYNGGQFLYSR